MKLPNIWGPGNLFAYSGLDGTCTYSGSLVGTLCGDRIGVIFYTKIKSQLSLVLKDIKDIDYTVVASDIVQGDFTGINGERYPFTLLFYAQDTVIGQTTESALPVVFVEEAVDVVPETIGNIRVYTCGGEYVAFAVNRAEPLVSFAYAVSSLSKQDAADKAAQAMQADMQLEAAKKIGFFIRLPETKTSSEDAERLYYKCFSTMKSQVYTPEGRFRSRWTTPDRLPHKRLWLWDSVFHSIGNKLISAELAYDSIKAIFDTQHEDGFIPHMSTPFESSEVTQPPVIAWGLYELYLHSGNGSILEECYEGLKKYLLWNKQHRDRNGNWLFEWQVEEDSVHCRCDECGMDNSPRFDDVKEMDCIDFSCFMANEARVMAKIAAVLGRREDTEFWQKWFGNIKTAVNGYLWNDRDQFYYDRLLQGGEWKKVKAVSSFLPLFAGICEPDQAEALVRHLEDPASFRTELPIPSISLDDPTFGTDMWRGPVWINYNYMISRGLKEYGYRELAQKIIQKTIDALTFRYSHDGTVYEFYDSMNKVSPRQLNRKSKSLKPYQFQVRMQSIRDYGWSCTLLPAMMLESEAETETETEAVSSFRQEREAGNGAGAV